MKNTLSYKSYQKSPYTSIKHSTYFHAYDHFLNPFKNQEITFVEIGVLDGGSLFMWRDYFGSKARIIGVDLNPDAKKWEKEGFEIFIGSQSDEGFWKEFIHNVDGIDVVLDDGGHSYNQQIVTTECLLNSINDGGLILVEDTHTSYMAGFGNQNFSFLEYVKGQIDKLNMRFGEFPEEESEGRFWSIEIVESMVAFKINKDATAIKSEPTNNGGSKVEAKDFRYDDESALASTEKYFINHISDFNAELYLSLNPDVKAAGVNPYQHYLEFGIKECRRTR